MSAGSAYPFLRTTKLLLRIFALLYVVLGVLLAIAVASDGISNATREAVVWVGGSETGRGGFASFLLLLAVAIKVTLILAVTEMIQLLLDVRNDTRPRV